MHPLQLLGGSRGRCRHPAHHLSPGTGGSQPRRRLQSRHQRTRRWRLHHAGGPRGRKRLRRRGPGLRRFRTHPPASRFCPSRQGRRPPHLHPLPKLPRSHQVVGTRQRSRPHPRYDAEGLQPTQVRPSQPRPSRTALGHPPNQRRRRHSSGLQARPKVPQRLRSPGGP